MPGPGKVTRKRRRILIAGEGKSEQSLVAWLQKLCIQRERRVHFEFVSSGGGDSLEVVRLAIRTRRKQADTRRRCEQCVALLDSDRLMEDTKRQRDAIALAMRNDVRSIFIQPNLEGFLIRLHKGQESRQVPTEAVPRELKKRLKAPSWNLSMFLRRTAALPLLTILLTHRSVSNTDYPRSTICEKFRP